LLITSWESRAKTTVYNTLRILIDAGIIRVITIEDNETRYDINLKPHGHFKCNSCGEVFDFNIDIDSLRSEGLHGFKVYDKDVYFKGVCPNCLSK
jgi:Fe2+ or Zn2+ uptake regulation protein